MMWEGLFLYTGTLCFKEAQFGKDKNSFILSYFIFLELCLGQEVKYQSSPNPRDNCSFHHKDSITKHAIKCKSLFRWWTLDQWTLDQTLDQSDLNFMSV